MKTMLKITLFLQLLFFSQIDAQTTHRFFLNKINLPINNKGNIANVNISNPDPIINGAGAKYDENTFLFNFGFFLSGNANGNFFSTCIAEFFNDYLPGTVGSLPEDPINSIYVVNADDEPFSQSWQNWKDAVLLGADFYDGNNNGIYDPVDLNNNNIWDLNEDMPPILGDQIAWCVYNDGVYAEQKQYNAPPFGIEIQQTLFASKLQNFENIIFIKYKITNTGLVTDVIDSVYFSPWDDTDIGYPTDDLNGCDTNLNSVFTYNAGSDDYYGINPPAVFTSILQGPINFTNNSEDIAYINNGFILGQKVLSGYKNLGLYSFTGYAKNSPGQSFPDALDYVKNYINGKDGYGNYLNPCDSLWGYTFGNIDCSSVNPVFWFSGDPVSKSGWLDIIKLDDRKFSSTGPFKLEKDKPIEIILALVIGRGSDELNSITIARENVLTAKNEYENNFFNLTYKSNSTIDPVSDYNLFQNYPNPFNPVTKIKYSIVEFPIVGKDRGSALVTLKVYDVLGNEVATLVNEEKVTGVYETYFDGSAFSSGVYFYQLKVYSAKSETVNFIQTNKMVLLK
jgi:hypothetical protein